MESRDKCVGTQIGAGGASAMGLALPARVWRIRVRQSDGRTVRSIHVGSGPRGDVQTYRDLKDQLCAVFSLAFADTCRVFVCVYRDSPPIEVSLKAKFVLPYRVILFDEDLDVALSLQLAHDDKND